MDVVGAIDVGGTKIAVGLVDRDGQILEQEVTPSEPVKQLPGALDRLEHMLRACQERQPGARVIGIGVGCTGPVDPVSGMLGPNTFLPGWEGFNLIDLLRAHFGVPAAVENDADAAALGETAWGAGRGASRCIYITVSTGIGGGIVLDGALYRGAGGAHPELGHIVIQSGQGEPCFCGARGCWENLASGPALAGWYNTQARERGLKLPEVDARAVCQRSGEGDALAQEAVQREGMYLGVGLANLITAFVPEVIVLGGGVMQSWPLFESQVRSVIRQNCGLVPWQRTELRMASLGARTGLAGAARVWYHRYI